MRRLQADGRPLYARAKEAIRDLLVEQAYAAGRRIPPEQELAGRLGTSRSTVREALKALEHEGLLVSRRGSGTYVANAAPLAWAGLETLRSTTVLLRDQGLQPAVRHLRIAEEHAAPPNAGRLGLEPGATLVVIERVRTADGEPLCYVRDEVVALPDLLARYRAAEPPSLLEFLRTEYGLTVEHSQCEIRAAAADARTARALGVSPGRSLIQMDQVHFTEQRRPIFFSRSYWRTDRFAFRVFRRAVD